MARKQNNNDKRLEHFERLITPSSADHALIDPDAVAVLDELASLKEGPHWRRGVKVEGRDKAREFYGRPYTHREYHELGVSRALEKRGHPPAQIAEAMDGWMMFFEQEYGHGFDEIMGPND